MVAATVEAVLDGDAAGVANDVVVRGDRRTVDARRQAAPAHWRGHAAVQAELDKLQPAGAVPAVAAETLRRDREAVEARGGIGPKTAGKVATDRSAVGSFTWRSSGCTSEITRAWSKRWSLQRGCRGTASGRAWRSMLIPGRG